MRDGRVNETRTHLPGTIANRSVVFGGCCQHQLVDLEFEAAGDDSKIGQVTRHEEPEAYAGRSQCLISATHPDGEVPVGQTNV